MLQSPVFDWTMIINKRYIIFSGKCTEGDEMWLRYENPYLEYDPGSFADDKMMEGNPDVYTFSFSGKELYAGLFPNSEPSVCLKVMGHYVEMYTVHFWASQFDSVTIQLYDGDNPVADQVYLNY